MRFKWIFNLCQIKPQTVRQGWTLCRQHQKKPWNPLKVSQRRTEISTKKTKILLNFMPPVGIFGTDSSNSSEFFGSHIYFKSGTSKSSDQGQHGDVIDSNLGLQIKMWVYWGGNRLFHQWVHPCLRHSGTVANSKAPFESLMAVMHYAEMSPGATDYRAPGSSTWVGQNMTSFSTNVLKGYKHHYVGDLF